MPTTTVDDDAFCCHRHESVMHFCCVFLSFFETDLMDFLCEKKTIRFLDWFLFCVWILMFKCIKPNTLNAIPAHLAAHLMDIKIQNGWKFTNRTVNAATKCIIDVVAVFFFYLYTYHFVRLPVNTIVSVVVVKIDIVNCQFIHKFISWKTQNMLNGLLSFTPPHSFVL